MYIITVISTVVLIGGTSGVIHAFSSSNQDVPSHPITTSPTRIVTSSPSPNPTATASTTPTQTLQPSATSQFKLQLTAGVFSVKQQMKCSHCGLNQTMSASIDMISMVNSSGVEKMIWVLSIENNSAVNQMACLSDFSILDTANQISATASGVPLCKYIGRLNIAPNSPMSQTGTFTGWPQSGDTYTFKCGFTLLNTGEQDTFDLVSFTTA